MNRYEKVYGYLNDSAYIPVKKDELRVLLGVPDEDREEFSGILERLFSEGKIIYTKKGRIIASEKNGMYICILRCAAYGRYAFADTEDDSGKSFYISPEDMNGAYDGDKVLCAEKSDLSTGGNPEGRVIKVISRGRESITGVTAGSCGSFYIVIPDSKKIYAEIHIAKEDMQGQAEGRRVLAAITAYPRNGVIEGKVIKDLGGEGELLSHTEAIIAEYGIKTEFAPETQQEADNAPVRISPKEAKNRTDLRDKIIFTIDGADARDFDDAVSVEKTPEGEYLLGVHIADVTEYVHKGSMLDREAYQRGTSVYLPDRVIPMLPKELSNGICSLNPRVNRLALSVFMRIDKNGNIGFEAIKKTVIRSCERLTYDIAARLLSEPSERDRKRYKAVIPALEKMKELALILKKKREERGSIDFDFPESKIITNDLGEPVEIKREKRLISHMIIEEFMIAANETVAEFAFWAEMPFIYRVHEAPSLEKTLDFNRFLNNFGLGFKGKISADDPPKPKAFSDIQKRAAGMAEEEMIMTYMLRSLMKAEYKAENLGHFGLAARYYCHFTSPIRRYPDLFIHRVIKEYIEAEDTGVFLSDAPGAAAHSSKTERGAEMCERDCDELMKTAYMAEHIGEEFSGKVSSLTSFGMFVRLDNTVEGLIRYESMKDDRYEYDDIRGISAGKRTKREYRIGDTIDSVVVRCDLLSRRIELIRSEDNGTDISKGYINKEIKGAKKGRKRTKSYGKKGGGRRKRSRRNGRI